jgi:2-polyprenyl-3-methyl-5-hydroxy-6-metoxy-1,4-benzoquinol methylase
MSHTVIASNLGLYQDGIEFDSFLYDMHENANLSAVLVMCDGIMPACQMSKFPRTEPKELAELGQDKTCKKCIKNANNKLGNRKVLWLSKYIKKEDVNTAESIVEKLSSEEFSKFILDGIKIGEHAVASAIRYFANTKYAEEQYSETITKKYILAGILVDIAYKRIIQQEKPNTIIAHHGIYIPQGIVIQRAKKENIKRVSWIKTYRKNTYLFSWDESYHYTMQNAPGDWTNFKFNEQQRKLALEYLEERKVGITDSIHFNRKPNNVKINKQIGKGRRFLLLSSVFWDAQLHYVGNLFGDQANWIISTVRLFLEKDVGQLIIRIHPAEVSGAIPSRDTVLDAIQKAFTRKFPDLTFVSNVMVVYPDNKASTYDLIDQCDAVIVYNTKMAIEAAAMGKPVIVAGDAWIKGTGFDVTPKSEKEYFDIIESTDLDINQSQKELAYKYFYNFYFRRMYEFELGIKGKGEIESSNAMSLLDSLLNNKEFIVNDKLNLVKKRTDKQYWITKIIGDVNRNLLTLKYEEEIIYSKDILDFLNIKSHHDRTKNWDILGYLSYINNNADKNASILDAGSGNAAVLADRLYDIGYRNLYAVDLKPRLKNKEIENRIKFTSGSIEELQYTDEKFDVVGLLSVIEHLESYEKVLQEIYRVLKPDGFLVLSTDYWIDEIDCKGIYPYGQDAPEMKIFSKNSILQMIEFARKVGFQIEFDGIDLEVGLPVCFWERVGRRYTFIRLILKK